MANFNLYASGDPAVTALHTQGMVHVRIGDAWVMLTPAEAQALSVALAAAAVELGQPVILTGNADLEQAA